MCDRMKEPCSNCPFRADVEPFLRPERGASLAYSATNPYNEFFCHKTLDRGDVDTMVTGRSLLCAGFLSMQINETGQEIAGFTPSDLVYGDVHQMVDAYADADA